MAISPANNGLFLEMRPFLFIQKIIGHGGYVRVSAPVGKHDDFVTVVVLCAAMAIRFGAQSTKFINDEDKVLTDPFDKAMATINNKQGETKSTEGWL